MSHDLPSRLCPALSLLFAVAFLCLSAPSAVRAGTQPPSVTALQTVFHDAALAFGVPESVLLAVSYNESLWEDHAGAPSTSGGYGPMHLTHVDWLPEIDAKGTGLLLHNRSVRHDPALHTLDTAARLLGLPLRTLERDPVQNIRGGAALLALYARRTTGGKPSRVADWYGAVAAYSGSRQSQVALTFADTVFATLRHGASRLTSGRQEVRLLPQRVSPDRATAGPLHLEVARPAKAECPKRLLCRFLPAAYTVNNPSDPTDYGNYDAAARPKDGLAIRYIVIHDTEGTYNSAIASFQNPTRYASANYVIRSADGQITQMVPDKDIAWHAGNYYVNMHAIGIEHEGVAVQGATWYSEQMYQSSATLVRYLAHRYHIPLDRAHILGHDDVPGLTPSSQSAQHWDPGPFWDWSHYMDLLGAPITPTGDSTSTIVTVDPAFPFNEPPVSSCSSAGTCADLPAQPANFVYLYTAPSQTAPLLSDPALHPAGEAGTTRANDWGDKAVTGQEFYVVDRQRDWIAIDYGGQEAWLDNPGGDVTAPSTGTTVTPKPGLASIPVYGEAYPARSAYPPFVKEPEKIVPLQYTIPAGQTYVATDQVTADYYWSPTQARHAVILGHTSYYQIFFNHRQAFVKASDVTVQAPSSGSRLSAAVLPI